MYILFLHWVRGYPGGLEILRAEPVSRFQEVVALLRAKLARSLQQQSTGGSTNPTSSHPHVDIPPCQSSTECFEFGGHFFPPSGDAPAGTVWGCLHLLALSDEHDGPALTPSNTCACDRLEGRCRPLEEVYPFLYTCRVIAVDDQGFRSRDHIVTFEVAQGEQAGKQFTARVRLGHFDGLLDAQGQGITVLLRISRPLNLDDPQRPDSVQPEEIAWEHLERMDEH